MADPSFSGSLPDVYERVMVPTLFQPYADAVADRVAAWEPPPARLLEVACGTGVLTRALAARLPGAQLLATDLSPEMLAAAARVGTPPGVAWQPADARELPAGDAGVDAVLCQFGVMFVPDRVAAYREARRVLAPGGRLLVTVWTGLEGNDLAAAVDDALSGVFPEGAPRFMRSVPHGHGDPEELRSELAAGGFGEVDVEVLALTSRAPSTEALATGFLTGTPIGRQLPPGSDPAAVHVAVTAALRERLGDGEVAGVMTALVATARP